MTGLTARLFPALFAVFRDLFMVDSFVRWEGWIFIITVEMSPQFQFFPFSSFSAVSALYLRWSCSWYLFSTDRRSVLLPGALFRSLRLVSNVYLISFFFFFLCSHRPETGSPCYGQTDGESHPVSFSVSRFPGLFLLRDAHILSGGGYMLHLTPTAGFASCSIISSLCFRRFR